jgi:PAS domain S-box-containing protein
MALLWGPERVQVPNQAFCQLFHDDPTLLGAVGTSAWSSWVEPLSALERQLAPEDGGEAPAGAVQTVPAVAAAGRVRPSRALTYLPVLGAAGEPVAVLAMAALLDAPPVAETAAPGLQAAALEHAIEAVLLVDERGLVGLVNAAAERMLGRSRREIVGRPLLALLPISVAAMIHERGARALARGEPEQFELSLAPGTAALARARGAAGGLTLYLDDITDDRRTRRALEERSHLLTIAGHMARIGGWSLTREGTIRWSPDVCAIHEVPAGTRPTLDQALAFYAEPWRAQVAQAVDACLARGEPFDLEAQIVTAKGRPLWVRAIGEAVRGADGSFARVQGAFQDIQQQRDAAEQVRESERRLRELAESMPLVVWSATADGAIDYQTRSIHEFTGWSSRDLSGDGWYDVLHPDDAAHVEGAWRHSVATGEPYEVEFRIRGVDGRYHWFLTRAVPYRDPTGAIIKWYGSSIDVDEHLRVRERARTLARELTATLQSVTDAVYMLDREWRFTFVNTEAERLLERSANDLLGQPLWAEFPSTLGSELESQYREAVRLGRPAAFRFRYDALERWFDVRAYPSTLGLAVYFRDITADVEAEARLREQAALLDRARDAILVRDLDHQITFWSQGAERLYGWSKADALGASVRDLLHADPSQFDDATRAVITEGEWTGEIEHQTRQGARVTVEGRWSLVRDVFGEPHRILAINTDISDRKRLQAQSLRAQRLESIGTLAGGIAHDLNNVLAPIVLSIGLLRERVREPELHDPLAIIESSAHRGAEMVKQVLGFARGYERNAGDVDLRRLLAEIDRVVRDTFPKNIKYQADIPATLWPISGDATQIHQVLVNLLVNARDAMPRGGTIRLNAQNVDLDAHYAAMSANATPGPYVRISVIDTGSGMSADLVAKIFDPFFTTKAFGVGTGLGLSTVSSIVNGHGGVVSVYSEPDVGTTFRVYLPASATTVAPTLDAAADALVRGRGERILLVDDESCVRDIARQTLEAFGYRVVTAADGAEAIAEYAQRGSQIALVVTDMLMPIMDGPATVRALTRMNPQVRMIGVSGLDMGNAVARAADAGLRHFLPKPYTAASLLRLVRDVLDDRVS